MSDHWEQDDPATEGDIITVNGESFRVEETDQHGRVIAVQKVGGESEVPEPLMVWVWKNVIIGVGALMTGVFLWTTAWVAWLIHFSGVPFSDPRVQQFREDPVGMMAEPLISGYVETVLLLIPLLLAGFAVGVVLRTAWDRFHSRAGGDADGN